jgi:hypothetical protein
VLFSLVLHLWLCLVSYYTYLGMAAQTEVDLARAEDRQRLVRQPEHTWQISEHAEATNLLERAVETEMPEADRTDPQRTQPAVAMADKPSLEEPATSQPRLPSPAELEKAKITAPRRSEQLTGPTISRSDMADPQPAVSPVEVPRVEPRTEEQHTAESAATELERLADAVQLERRVAPQEPIVQPSQTPGPPDFQRHATPAAPASQRPAAVDRPQRALADAPEVQPVQVTAPRIARTDDSRLPPDPDAATATQSRAANTSQEAIARAASREERVDASEPE